MTTSFAHTRVSHWRFAIMPVALAGVVGCGSSPDLDQELSTVHSWTATARLASSDERSGAISHRLAVQVHDRATEARREAATMLADLARSATERPRAQAALDSLDAAMRGLGAQPVAR
jgi:hypothetical protein